MKTIEMKGGAAATLVKVNIPILYPLKSLETQRRYKTGTLTANELIKNATISNLNRVSYMCNIWDKVFKNGPSEICGRQLFKHLKWHGLLKQTISLQIF